MQILIGFAMLCLIGIITAFAVFGVVRIERAIARWLLLDARAWEARERAKARDAAEVAEVV